ncbi:hypothetical protein ABZU45_20410 [Streptomyces avermitilis]|uniref:hypothetical protein n=1 Tax=Streptomyces avermitilis TaxID=33903 RepID=UPI0033A56455
MPDRAGNHGEYRGTGGGVGAVTAMLPDGTGIASSGGGGFGPGAFDLPYAYGAYGAFGADLTGRPSSLLPIPGPRDRLVQVQPVVRTSTTLGALRMSHR